MTYLYRKLKLIWLTVFVLLGCFGCASKDEATSKPEMEIVTEPMAEEVHSEVVAEEVFVEPEVDLIMVGDILLHDNVQNSGKLADGTYNYDHLFANVIDEIQTADVAIANQEIILGGTELGLSGYPRFNGPYEVADALVMAGFDVILHATNHTMDKGKQGLVNCMNYWEENYSEIEVLGVFGSQEDYDNEIYIYEKDGLKIAILNYTYGTNGLPLPKDMPYAVALLEEEKVIDDLQRAESMADFTVVCPHWGTEYMHKPSTEQKEWADLFMNYGADLVIGTHPHYIQTVEMQTEENGKQMLVYYSLGNFINSTNESGRGTADRMIGAMAKVTIAKNEEGDAYIKEYGAEPLVTQLLYGPQEITTYKLSDYTEELAAQNQIVKKDSVFNLTFCRDLCEDVFGDLY